ADPDRLEGQPMLGCFLPGAIVMTIDLHHLDITNRDRCLRWPVRNRWRDRPDATIDEMQKLGRQLHGCCRSSFDQAPELHGACRVGLRDTIGLWAKRAHVPSTTRLD